MGLRAAISKLRARKPLLTIGKLKVPNLLDRRKGERRKSTPRREGLEHTIASAGVFVRPGLTTSKIFVTEEDRRSQTHSDRREEADRRKITTSHANSSTTVGNPKTPLAKIRT